MRFFCFFFFFPSIIDRSLCARLPVTRAAGAEHGQEVGPERMEALIRAAGRVPAQRTTLYGTPPAAQVAASFGAPPLRPLVSPPAFAARKR